MNNVTHEEVDFDSQLNEFLKEERKKARLKAGAERQRANLARQREVSLSIKRAKQQKSAERVAEKELMDKFCRPSGPPPEPPSSYLHLSPPDIIVWMDDGKFYYDIPLSPGPLVISFKARPMEQLMHEADVLY